MTALARLAPSSPHRQRIEAGLIALLVTSVAFGMGYAFAGHPLVAAGAALAVLAIIACLARPDAATYVVVAILYSNAAAVAVREHGLPDFVGLAFPLALALPLAHHLLLRRQNVTITSALPFLFGFLLIHVLGAFAAREPGSALGFLIVFLISGFGLFFVVTNVVRSFSVLRYVVWTILAAAAVIGALSTFQAVTGTYANDYWGFSTVNLPGRGTSEVLASLTGTPRHEGSIGEINRYGQIMLVLVPIGALLALGERRRLLQVVAVILTTLILFGMATSFSRGAALGLGVVLLVAVMFRYVRPAHLLLLVMAVAVVLVAFPRYGERLLDLQGLTGLDRSASGAVQVQGDTGNLRGRATSTLAALFVFADHPLVGVGRGQFSSYYQEYAGAVADAGVDTRIDQSARQAHNLFTAVAAETGGLGFACFMGLILITMRDLNRARRRWLKSRPEVAHLATGFLLAIVGYLATGMTLHLSYERYLWLLLALASILAHLALKGDESRDLAIDESEPRRGAPRPLPSASV